MYRYSPKKYASSLLAMGSIRIGTLHDFRRSEHKKGIADAMEGKKEIHHYIENRVIENSDQADIDSEAIKYFKQFKVTGDCELRIRKMKIEQEINIFDCFILCSSSRLSKETMNEFEGADACVRIHDSALFYEQITQALSLITPVFFKGVKAVKYQNKTEKWNGEDFGSNPLFIKDQKFNRQCEIRAVWTAREGVNIEPVILTSYQIGEACEEVRV